MATENSAKRGKIYITRHGQTASAKEMRGKLGAFDDRFPDDSVVLSKLGREQATSVGIRLMQEGFHGIILSSPYVPTMLTASLIASVTGCMIYPCREIQEISFGTDFEVRPYQDIAGMREYFPHIAPDAELSFPWVFGAEKNLDEVTERIRKVLPPVLEKYADTDILFVGHGASVEGTLIYLEIPRDPRFENDNCALSMIDPNGIEPPRFCSLTHLSYDKWTSNRVTAANRSAERYRWEWKAEIPDIGIRENHAEKVVLHIGDTYSWQYIYYRKLIGQIRPDVIVHTGNLAAEVEAVPLTTLEYETKVRAFSEMLAGSGAEIILTPGERDRIETVREAFPYAQILPSGGITSVGGHRCFVANENPSDKADAEYVLCTHGGGTEDAHCLALEDRYTGVYTFDSDEKCRMLSRLSRSARNEDADDIPEGSFTVYRV